MMPGGVNGKANYFCCRCGISRGWYPKDGSPNTKNGLSYEMSGSGRTVCPIHRIILRAKSRSCK